MISKPVSHILMSMEDSAAEFGRVAAIWLEYVCL